MKELERINDLCAFKFQKRLIYLSLCQGVNEANGNKSDNSLTTEIPLNHESDKDAEKNNKVGLI